VTEDERERPEAEDEGDADEAKIEPLFIVQ
jgi:hypothetical protein